MAEDEKVVVRCLRCQRKVRVRVRTKRTTVACPGCEGAISLSSSADGPPAAKSAKGRRTPARSATRKRERSAGQGSPHSPANKRKGTKRAQAIRAEVGGSPAEASGADAGDAPPQQTAVGLALLRGRAGVSLVAGGVALVLLVAAAARPSAPSSPQAETVAAAPPAPEPTPAPAPEPVETPSERVVRLLARVGTRAEGLRLARELAEPDGAVVAAVAGLLKGEQATSAAAVLAGWAEDAPQAGSWQSEAARALVRVGLADPEAPSWLWEALKIRPLPRTVTSETARLLERRPVPAPLAVRALETAWGLDPAAERDDLLRLRDLCASGAARPEPEVEALLSAALGVRTLMDVASAGLVARGAQNALRQALASAPPLARGTVARACRKLTAAPSAPLVAALAACAAEGPGLWVRGGAVDALVRASQAWPTDDALRAAVVAVAARPLKREVEAEAWPDANVDMLLAERAMSAFGGPLDREALNALERRFRQVYEVARERDRHRASPGLWRAFGDALIRAGQRSSLLPEALRHLESEVARAAISGLPCADRATAGALRQLAQAQLQGGHRVHANLLVNAIVAGGPETRDDLLALIADWPEQSPVRQSDWARRYRRYPGSAEVEAATFVDWLLDGDRHSRRAQWVAADALEAMGPLAHTQAKRLRQRWAEPKLDYQARDGLGVILVALARREPDALLDWVEAPGDRAERTLRAALFELSGQVSADRSAAVQAFAHRQGRSAERAALVALLAWAPAATSVPGLVAKVLEPAFHYELHPLQRSVAAHIAGYALLTGGVEVAALEGVTENQRRLLGKALAEPALLLPDRLDTALRRWLEVEAPASRSGEELSDDDLLRRIDNGPSEDIAGPLARELRRRLEASDDLLAEVLGKVLYRDPERAFLAALQAPTVELLPLTAGVATELLTAARADARPTDFGRHSSDRVARKDAIVLATQLVFASEALAPAPGP